MPCAHTRPDPALAPETDAERRDRQLAALREISELGLQLARAAAARALAPESPDPAAPDPNLAFARAASVVRQAIALEIRIAAGTPEPAARPAQNPDPRRPPLRQMLHKFADSEPDRAARAQLRRDLDERLDDELRADPDADLPLAEILVAICDELGLPVDLAKLPSAFLAIPPAPRPTAPEPPD